MKRIVTTLVVAAVACLAFASIASAHHSVRSHANVQPGPCRSSHLHHRAAY